MSKIKQLVDSMDPYEAASEIAMIMKNLFPLLSEEARLKFVAGLADQIAAGSVQKDLNARLANWFQ